MNNSNQKKELLLLRHGKSDWATNTTDFYRPLKNRGKRQVRSMGIWLAEKNLVPDIIISSPAVRALKSAEKIGKTMGLDPSIIYTEQRIYEAQLCDLLQVLSEITDTLQRILLVGHNPGLEELLKHLAGKQAVPRDGKLLRTATLAYLRLKHDWPSLGANDATECTVTEPASLPDSFPFTSTTGIEFRSRPAYYYSQSSVIPYRITDHKLEIMLISSRSHKHWIVPKGIIEPGLSSLRSAEKEALEEAGIKGITQDALLGQYHYKKWGAQCSVDVFAMEVTREIPESHWSESHRKRQWLSIDEAKRRISQVALHPLIEKLKQQIT